MRVLLFSGGVESTCLAHMARPDLAVTIDYGQVCADGERRAASYIASLLGLRHEIITAPLAHLGAGDLTGAPTSGPAGAVPEHWPFRNQLLITIAVMALSAHSIRQLIIGTVSTDRVHNDGTPQFLAAMQGVLQAQMPDFRLSAPAADMTTEQLVRASEVSRDVLGWTFSCHRAPVACGVCRGCNKTLELFARIDEGSKDSRYASATRAVS